VMEEKDKSILLPLFRLCSHQIMGRKNHWSATVLTFSTNTS